MTTPFFRGFDRYDLFVAALVCRSMNYGGPNDAERILRAVEPGGGRIVPPDASTPGAICYVTPRFIFVAIAGTETFAQWVVNVLGSVQASQPPIPGSVALTFAGVAHGIWNKIRTFAEPHLAGRQVVLMGHSLGGAAIQCLVPIMQQAGAGEAAIFCFGAPRVGNPAFADAVGAVVHRVENTSDPIPALPPEHWAGADSRFPLPGLPPIAIYQHAGAVQTLNSAGALTDGGNGVGLPAAISAWMDWDAPTHGAEVYVSRLSVNLELDPVPPEVGYDDSAAIGSLAYLYHPLPAIKKGIVTMPYLTQGIMYFRSNNGPQEGWEESVYFESEVDPVLSILKNSLIPARTSFLSKQAEIHAYRAARADGTRLSKVVNPLSPYVGQQSGPVNEFGDCINYQFRDNAGSKRTWSFRAVPDLWIEGKKLTPQGIAGTGQIDAFASSVISNGGALKVPFAGNPKIVISEIKNNPFAGGPIEITSANPHGLSSKDLVNITGLSGYPYLRGHWRVKVVDTLNFTLVSSQRYNVSLLTDIGEWQFVSYVSSALFTYGFQKVSYRDTGVPFGQEHGKQSAKVLHH